jgi:hypothetical protein
MPNEIILIKLHKYLGNSGATCRLYKIGTAHADSIFKPENDP